MFLFYFVREKDISDEELKNYIQMELAIELVFKK